MLNKILALGVSWFSWNKSILEVPKRRHILVAWLPMSWFCLASNIKQRLVLLHNEIVTGLIFQHRISAVNCHNSPILSHQQI